MAKSKERAPTTNQGEPEPYSYSFLKGHRRTDGTFKSTDQLHMEYITLTDQLIETIQNGTEHKNPETGEIERQPFDTVIFLDKSARPVAWLMRELWSKLATDSGGNETPMPNINFLNIDRKQWRGVLDPNGVGLYDIGLLPNEAMYSLRSIFTKTEDIDNLRDDVNNASDLPAEIMALPSSLDGKNVLIVDEVKSSGDTIKIATKILSKTFPTASFDSAYWMSSMASKVVLRAGGVAYGNADLPVWYDEFTISGRGVGDRQKESNVASATRRQKLGSWFLSSRLPGKDELSLQLRDELHQLATHPDVPIRPSLYRDDFEERTVRLNGEDFSDTIAKIKAIRDRR